MFLRCSYFFQNLSLDVLINKVLKQSNACIQNDIDVGTDSKMASKAFHIIWLVLPVWLHLSKYTHYFV